MTTSRDCPCGWPRPLIAITLADGGRPSEPYRVRYDCPVCGRVHHCGELSESQVRGSERALRLARGGGGSEPS